MTTGICGHTLAPIDLMSNAHRCAACDIADLEAGHRLKAQGQAQTLAAHPDDRAKVEAAIRQLAATGRPFSANQARAIHGVSGGVVGATFTAMKTAGVIRWVGTEPSSKANTHGHAISKWQGTTAPQAAVA